MKTTIEQLKEMQCSIDALSRSNEALSARHHALMECMAFMLVHHKQVNASPKIFEKAVFEKINEGLECLEASENYKAALREEAEFFFCQIQAHRNAQLSFSKTHKESIH